jgi:AcrR family transcriptional regulator
MSLKKDTLRDLREECVEQALAIIADAGIDSLSLRDVARRLGVSHQAPYKHFPSREHILAEILRRAYSDFAGYLEKRVRAKHPRIRMRQLGAAYLSYAQENPLHYQLMFATPLPDPDAHKAMMAEASRAFRMLEDSIAALHGRASGRLDDALFVWATMHGLASIMKTRLGAAMGLSDAAIPRVSRHALGMIGKALEGEE